MPCRCCSLAAFQCASGFEQLVAMCRLFSLQVRVTCFSNIAISQLPPQFSAASSAPTSNQVAFARPGLHGIVRHTPSALTFTAVFQDTVPFAECTIPPMIWQNLSLRRWRSSSYRCATHVNVSWRSLVVLILSCFGLAAVLKLVKFVHSGGGFVSATFLLWSPETPRHSSPP